jgi:hypothetical protein
MSIWLIVLLLSCVGLHAFLVSKCRLSPYTAPLTVVCTVSLAVFGFGLIGFLKLGLIAVVVIGSMLGAWVLFTAPKMFLHWSTVIILVGCGLLWLRYRNALLLQYDDFSHWGLIARYLLTNDALPDQSAALIRFQSYPPAAACWIYAVGFFAGKSEGVMLAAQSWFMLIALLPLFAVSEKNTTIRSLGVAAVIVVVLSMYQGTASLMVDNLLAAVSIGAVATAVSIYKSPQRGAWPLAVMLAVLCLIKDSGLYFAAMIFGLQCYFTRRNRQSRKAVLPTLMLPVAVRIAWFVHIKIAFTAAGATKHAFTLQNMQMVSADRTWDDFVEIAKAVARNILSAHNQSLQILFILFAGCVVMVILRFLKTRKWFFTTEWKLLLSSLIAYGFYLFLLLAMYFFTMPIHAAKEAVAFERYNITFALLVYGVFAVYLMAVDLTALPFKRVMPFFLVLLLLIPVVLPSFHGGMRRLLAESYHVPIREQIYRMEQKRPLQPQESAALYLSDPGVQQDFVSFIAAYTFQQQIPIYTTDTVDSEPLPDVLYADKIDASLQKLVINSTTEVVTP